MSVILHTVLLSALLAGVHGGSYFMTAPRSMFKGGSFNLTVDIFNEVTTEVEVAVESKIYNKRINRWETKVMTSANGTFGMNNTGMLAMGIPTEMNCTNCQLVVRGSSSYKFERSVSMYVSSVVTSVVIQTDKAMYRPGDLVRLRAFAVHANLMVYDGQFDVFITDPNGNRIQQWLAQNSTEGVVLVNFALCEETLLGMWKIHVTATGTQDTMYQTFQVKNYEMPKFEVDIDIAAYGLTSDVSLTGYVNAKYTYGEPVTGLVELHIGPNMGPNFCGNMPKTTTLSFEINGKAMFALPKVDLQRAVRLYDRTAVKVVALVTESSTGIMINATRIITFFDEEHTLRFLETTPEVFKPGLPLMLFLQVSTPDGLPPIGNTDPVYVYTVASYQFTVDDQKYYCTNEFTGMFPLTGQNLTLPDNGILPVEVDIPDNATSITVKVTFKGRSTYKTIKKTFSRSSSFLQLRLLGKYIQAGNLTSFSVSGTEDLYAITYVIVARGMIVDTGTVNGTGNRTFTFDLMITTAMAPTCRILVYYIRHDNEVVADSIAFLVEGLFENRVTVSFGVDISEPGAEVDVRMTADPNSMVNLLALDESVLHLKSGNDVTVGRIEHSLRRFDFGQRPTDAEFAVSYSAASTIEVFQKTGLLVLTDLDLYSNYHYNHDCGPPLGETQPNPYPLGKNVLESLTEEAKAEAHAKAQGKAIPEVFPGMGNLGDYNAMGPPMDILQEQAAQDFFLEVEHIKRILPEAWLWESHTVEDEGERTIQATVPKSITSWVASAFATNLKTGLGVALRHARLQVFRSFFTVLTCPSSVIRGEELVIQVTVFNYLTEPVTVNVTLTGNDMFRNIYVSKTGQQTYDSDDRVLQVTVEPDKQGLVFFPIQTVALGVISVEIQAQASVAAFTAREQIRVRPEGVPVAFNFPFLVNGLENSGGVYSNEVTLTLPESVVPGSISSRVKATGDLLGISMDSLMSLMTIPTGCGEQTVVKFAPSVYVAQYLQATGQLTDELKEHVVDILIKGYQRQLMYKRHDGSFSAFGNLDERGSTWLTAFVALTLNEASQFIYVDPTVLFKAVKWLIQRQHIDGSFDEFGTVFDRALERSKSGPALTAFVLAALEQNKDISHEEECREDRLNCQFYYRWTNATSRATRHLEHHIFLDIDRFTLSIISYALRTAGSQMAIKAHTRLMAYAVRDEKFTFWRDSGYDEGRTMLYRPNEWRPPREVGRSIDVITTSYALLDSCLENDLQLAFSVVHWLLDQRNVQGGFVSTHDTVFAMKAIASYAQKYQKPDTNMTVRFDSDKDETLEFNVTSENALTLQTKPFKEIPVTASVYATGSGLALAEIDYSFHVTQALVLPSFDVSIVCLDDDVDHFTLMICTKWLHRTDLTGMVVQEISVPSGFKAHVDSLRDVAGLKRVEKDGNLVSIYFDEITKASLCYNLQMTREGRVAKIQRNYIKTFDYYEPEYSSTVFFQPLRVAASTVCHVCKECCSLNFY
ncbi:CD109 antigen [Aplysia californica]|uniref:CD109 antigen n=1 Tax=Aplysia californica TaxID=6500 RepID=A0ABM0ZX43_APLCA|nr:CD109 antigen [Aplysia californica]